MFEIYRRNHKKIREETKMITKKILDKLKESEDPLTIKDICGEIEDDNQDKIRVYIKRLEKDKKIRFTGKISREKLYTINDPEDHYNLLKELHRIMMQYMNFQEKPSSEDVEIIKKIEEIIK